jgi:hypothetical protein
LPLARGVATVAAMTELERKLGTVRGVLAAHGLGAVRLRGLDWFAWATCGGSAAVLLAAETGVAEVLVAADGAFVLTDGIEAERLAEEEVPPGLPVVSHAWSAPADRERLVLERRGSGPVASDRPAGGELPLPPELAQARSTLLPEEVERYRAVGRDASAAVTDVLAAAQPTWTEHELAGAAAAALWRRGIHPALTLVAGERRLPLHRHPTPTAEPLGARAMLVVCARRHGLYANLTRFVSFRPPSPEERRLAGDVARVEAAALAASRPGARLGDVFAAIAAAYASAGHPGAEGSHHQGGPCGYLSRDAVALPRDGRRLAPGGAVAWNPSLPGAKIEDTALLGEGDLEILTADPRWPSTRVEGRVRPDLLVR